MFAPFFLIGGFYTVVPSAQSFWSEWKSSLPDFLVGLIPEDTLAALDGAVQLVPVQSAAVTVNWFSEKEADDM